MIGSWNPSCLLIAGAQNATIFNGVETLVMFIVVKILLSSALPLFTQLVSPFKAPFKAVVGS